MAQTRSQPPTTVVGFIGESFTIGYQRYGVKLSERAIRDFLACVDFAEANIDTGPSLLRLAESVGKKAGLRDTLYLRRERTAFAYGTQAQDWAASLSTVVPIDRLSAAVAAAYASKKSANDQRRDAKVAALVILQSALDDNPTLRNQGLTLAAQARAHGRAEGSAAAAAFVQHNANAKLPDMDSLVQQNFREEQRKATYRDHSGSAVQALLGGLAGDIAIHGGSAIHDQPSITQVALASALLAILAKGAGASFYMGEEVYSGYAESQKSYYDSAGLKVNFTTVGDDHVCPTCIAYEASNPYTMGTVPVPPVHGGCRCWLEPAS